MPASIFPTYKLLARIGPFEFVRKGYTFGHAYRVRARFGCRYFQLIISRRQFTLELGPA
jgi:hypothetical protein